MNYYYLGWYLLTVPMRALRLLPEVAFNLGVATYAAMTATVAFSTVHNLVALGTHRTRRPGNAAIGAGLLGVVLMCGIGNYDAVRQHIDRLQSVNTWTGPADWPVVGPVVAVIGGSWAWISGTPLPRFDWWGPSRVNSGNIDITEFPYFTFLFGDLHPHMMGMVFVGLAASIALAYLVAAHAGDRGRTMALAVGLGVVTAVSRMVNTWDLPTVAILTVGAIVIGQVIAPRRDRIDAPTGRAAVLAVAGLAVGLSSVGGTGGAAPLVIGAAGACGALALLLRPGAADRLLRAVGHLGAVAAVHVVATWPYVRTTETYDTGIGGAVATTPLDDHLTHWGLFLVVAVALAAGLIVDERRRRRWDDDPVALVPGTDAGDRVAVAAAIGALTLAALLALFTTSAVFALGVVGSVVMLALGLREIRRSEPDIGRIVVLGMFALGFAISSGVDLITLENDIERMNTVFKFWLQAWQLFALAAAAAIWQVVRILRDRPSGGHRSSQVWVGVVAVLVLAGLAYPLLGTRTRVETRFAALPVSLDGLDYLAADPVILRLDDPDGDGQATEVQVRIADDVPLIRWLRTTSPAPRRWPNGPDPRTTGTDGSPPTPVCRPSSGGNGTSVSSGGPSRRPSASASPPPRTSSATPIRRSAPAICRPTTSRTSSSAPRSADSVPARRWPPSPIIRHWSRSSQTPTATAASTRSTPMRCGRNRPSPTRCAPTRTPEAPSPPAAALLARGCGTGHTSPWILTSWRLPPRRRQRPPRAVTVPSPRRGRSRACAATGSARSCCCSR
jgi:uncharacterized membrane protein